MWRDVIGPPDANKDAQMMPVLRNYFKTWNDYYDMPRVKGDKLMQMKRNRLVRELSVFHYIVPDQIQFTQITWDYYIQELNELLEKRRQYKERQQQRPGRRLEYYDGDDDDDGEPLPEPSYEPKVPPEETPPKTPSKPPVLPYEPDQPGPMFPSLKQMEEVTAPTVVVEPPEDDPVWHVATGHSPPLKTVEYERPWDPMWDIAQENRQPLKTVKYEPEWQTPDVFHIPPWNGTSVSPSIDCNNVDKPLHEFVDAKIYQADMFEPDQLVMNAIMERYSVDVTEAAILAQWLQVKDTTDMQTRAVMFTLLDNLLTHEKNQMFFHYYIDAFYDQPMLIPKKFKPVTERTIKEDLKGKWIPTYTNKRSDGKENSTKQKDRPLNIVEKDGQRFLQLPVRRDRLALVLEANEGSYVLRLSRAIPFHIECIKYDQGYVTIRYESLCPTPDILAYLRADKSILFWLVLYNLLVNSTDTNVVETLTRSGEPWPRLTPQDAPTLNTNDFVDFINFHNGVTCPDGWYPAVSDQGLNMCTKREDWMLVDPPFEVPPHLQHDYSVIDDILRGAIWDCTVESVRKRCIWWLMRWCKGRGTLQSVARWLVHTEFAYPFFIKDGDYIRLSPTECGVVLCGTRPEKVDFNALKAGNPVQYIYQQTGWVARRHPTLLRAHFKRCAEHSRKYKQSIDELSTLDVAVDKLMSRDFDSSQGPTREELMKANVDNEAATGGCVNGENPYISDRGQVACTPQIDWIFTSPVLSENRLERMLRSNPSIALKDALTVWRNLSVMDPPPRWCTTGKRGNRNKTVVLNWLGPECIDFLAELETTNGPDGVDEVRFQEFMQREDSHMFTARYTGLQLADTLPLFMNPFDARHYATKYPRHAVVTFHGSRPGCLRVTFTDNGKIIPVDIEPETLASLVPVRDAQFFSASWLHLMLRLYISKILNRFIVHLNEPFEIDAKLCGHTSSSRLTLKDVLDADQAALKSMSITKGTAVTLLKMLDLWSPREDVLTTMYAADADHLGPADPDQLDDIKEGLNTFTVQELDAFNAFVESKDAPELARTTAYVKESQRMEEHKFALPDRADQEMRESLDDLGRKAGDVMSKARGAWTSGMTKVRNFRTRGKETVADVKGVTVPVKEDNGSLWARLKGHWTRLVQRGSEVFVDDRPDPVAAEADELDEERIERMWNKAKELGREVKTTFSDAGTAVWSATKQGATSGGRALARGAAAAGAALGRALATNEGPMSSGGPGGDVPCETFSVPSDWHGEPIGPQAQAQALAEWSMATSACGPDYPYPAFDVDQHGTIQPRCAKAGWMRRVIPEEKKLGSHMDADTKTLLNALIGIGRHWCPSWAHTVELWRWVGVSCMGKRTTRWLAQMALDAQIGEFEVSSKHHAAMYKSVVDASRGELDDLNEWLDAPAGSKSASSTSKCRKRIMFLSQMISSNILFPYVTNRDKLCKLVPHRTFVFLDDSNSGGIVLQNVGASQSVQVEDVYQVVHWAPSTIRLYAFIHMNGSVLARNNRFYRDILSKHVDEAKACEGLRHMQAYAIRAALPATIRAEFDVFYKQHRYMAGQEGPSDASVKAKEKEFIRLALLFESRNLTMEEIKVLEHIKALEAKDEDVTAKAKELYAKSTGVVDVIKPQAQRALCNDPRLVPIMRERLRLKPTELLTRAEMCAKLFGSEIGGALDPLRIGDLENIPKRFKAEDGSLKMVHPELEGWLMLNYGTRVTDLKGAMGTSPPTPHAAQWVEQSKTTLTKSTIQNITEFRHFLLGQDNQFCQDNDSCLCPDGPKGPDADSPSPDAVQGRPALDVAESVFKMFCENSVPLVSSEILAVVEVHKLIRRYRTVLPHTAPKRSGGDGLGGLTDTCKEILEWFRDLRAELRSRTSLQDVQWKDVAHRQEFKGWHTLTTPQTVENVWAAHVTPYRDKDKDTINKKAVETCFFMLANILVASGVVAAPSSEK